MIFPERALERLYSFGAGTMGQQYLPPYDRHVTAKLKEYVEAGYALSLEERLEAARMLRLSVVHDAEHDADHDVAEIEGAWREGIGSRIDGILAGEVELVDADETYQLLAAELASKQQ